MRKEASFRMLFEKVRVSKRKLEIDDQKPPKKRNVSSHYEDGEQTRSEEGGGGGGGGGGARLEVTDLGYYQKG